MNANQQSTFTMTHEDDIAIITIDIKGESQNVLKQSFIDEVTDLLDEIERSESTRGVIICSGKEDTFIAGADINISLNFGKPRRKHGQPCRELWVS